jgi:dTMP kinase
LRRTLLEDPACRDLNPLATGLLIAAGRHDHLETVVRPALKRGAVVLCDRYVDSTWAYQYGADGLSKENVHSIINVATQGLKTNITFIFDLPVAAARARWQARDHGHDRYEGYDDSYHERVRAVFLERARAEPERCRVLDASLPRETLTAQITAEILKWR